MNPKPWTHAVPLRAIPPTKRAAKQWERKAEFSNYKKQPFRPEIPRPKQFKKKQSCKRDPECPSGSGANEALFDFCGVPPPFCSCSGVARRCYKSGPGGWQSSCCTNSLSEYPLPMSPCKPGKRITGRKMTGGAYRKLLCALAIEGRDLSSPVDLKNHWAKLGTNKFVTIK